MLRLTPCCLEAIIGENPYWVRGLCVVRAQVNIDERKLDIFTTTLL